MFGNTISMEEKALSYLYKKEEVLMNNMANVSTPGFKRTDVSFEEEFRSKLIEASGSKSSRAMPDAIAESNYTLYSRDDSARVDENNVNMDVEQTEFARSGLQYQYLMQSVNMDFKLLQTAIKGQ